MYNNNIKTNKSFKIPHAHTQSHFTMHTHIRACGW